MEAVYCVSADSRHASADGRKHVFGRIYPCWTWMRANLSLYYSLHTGKFRCAQISGNHWCADGECLRWKCGDAAIVWMDCRTYQYCGVAGIFIGDFGADVCDA